MAKLLSPSPRLQFVDANGKPFGGGSLFTYVAGTSTPQVTYADSAGTPNTNPVVLDAAGSAVVYLGANPYKFILKDVNAVTVFTQDNIFGGYATLTGAETLSNKTLDDSNVITVKDSNLTVEAAGATTAKFKFSAGSITPGNTRVITVPDQNTTLAGQDFQNVFTKRQEWGQGTDVASANDLTLSTDGNTFQINGVTQINDITTANWTKGSIVVLIFASGLTVKHNHSPAAGTAAILLQGNTDFVAASGDILVLQFQHSSIFQWVEISRSLRTVSPANTQPWAQGADIASANSLTLGTDGNTFIVTGATQINEIATAGWSKGNVIVLIFATGCLVKDEQSPSPGFAQILLQMGQDVQTQAGDVLVLQYQHSASNQWVEISRSYHTITGRMILVTKLTLTDAQIKTLPSTPIQIVAAPPAGSFIQVLDWAAYADLSAGIYTNVDNTATLRLQTINTVLAPEATKEIFKGSANRLMVHLGGGGSAVAAPYLTDYDNLAVLVGAYNNGMGDFTGGNAANSMEVFITYQIRTL